MNIWYEQILYNPKIQIKIKHIFLKHYFHEGIFLLYELYNLNGKVLSYEQILEMNIKTNLIEYCGIKKTVTSRTNHIALFGKIFGPHIPFFYKNIS